jgi:hypothetical protein
LSAQGESAQIGDGINVNIAPLSLEVKLDKVELANVDLTSLSVATPLYVSVDLKGGLSPLSVYPVHVALEGEGTRSPIRISLEGEGTSKAVCDEK